MLRKNGLLPEVIAVASIGIIAVSAAQADFVTPDGAINAPDHWSRGSANSTYVIWNQFESAYLGVNDTLDAAFGEGAFNPHGTPNLTQLNAPIGNAPPSIFVSGNQWIYGFGDPLNVSIDVPNANLGAEYETDVILQLRILAPIENPLLLETVQLDGVGYDAVLELSRITGTEMGFPTHTIEWWFKWNNVAGNAANYALSFQTYTETPASIGEHTILQAAAVDTRASNVPEPASISAVGAMGLLALARRRRAH